ncbi:hypothetical protein LHP98_16575 [Rhodobacter sp. Har01]|uniref:hypothetical protein n=1 Tax=Rhodobacter sp. Har01 TaxID=2883999 RepID=UPI001D06D479|nr:hypothetical protein [Rhodobacter sp. Har01]MCB6179738.1 hypothetical protein [Rhodobacter sp. Har01]
MPAARFDITAFLAAGPTEAERALLAHAAAGTLCQLSPTVPDPAEATAPRIRAELLAHLLTGGSPEAPVAPLGIRLLGAVIDGPLILSFSETRGETDLRLCAFTHPIAARRTRFAQLVLSGSHLPGLTAEGAEIAGSAFLLGVTVPGKLSFANAQIGGQLALHGATLSGLTAQGARIGASVYLRAASGTAFTCQGETSLSGAQIAGQLACDGGRFLNPGGLALSLQAAQVSGDVILRSQPDLPFHVEGELRLSGARIGGQLDLGGAELSNPAGPALSAQRMQVAAEFFWQDVTVATGTLHLPSAQVGDLVDDLASWPGEGRTYLDGLTYDRITRDAPTDAATRLTWLARTATKDGRFLPQPYAQCAATLHRMGHEAEARAIMEEQSRLKGRARRAAARAKGGLGAALAAFDKAWDSAARAIVGYGFAPFRALAWIAALCALSAALSAAAWNEGSMAPNNDLVAASEGWQRLLTQDCIPRPTPGCIANPAAAWNGPEGAGLDWESFHPLAYGIDVVVPVVELGQTRSWSPSKDRGPWGFTLWWARWPLIFAGWLVSALAAAAATGIIQRGVPS